MKARFAKIILLTAFILPVIGTYMLLNVQKLLVQQEVAVELSGSNDEKNYVLLTFATKDVDQQVTWKHAKEFKFNDQMYDIKRSMIQGDSVMYWCKLDKKEGEIDRKIDKLISSSNDDDSSKHHPKQKATKLLKTHSTNELFHYNVITSSTKKSFFMYKGLIRCREIRPPSPPPQLM